MCERHSIRLQFTTSPSVSLISPVSKMFVPWLRVNVQMWTFSRPVFFHRSQLLSGKWYTPVSAPVLCIRSGYKWDPWSFSLTSSLSSSLSCSFPDVYEQVTKLWRDKLWHFYINEYMFFFLQSLIWIAQWWINLKPIQSFSICCSTCRV